MERVRQEEAEEVLARYLEIEYERFSWLWWREKLWESTFTRIYTSHALSAWGDRMWEFLVPLFLAAMFPSTLFPAAMVLFTAQLACASLGTVMGRWVDNSPRLRVVQMSLLVQNISIVLCAVLLYLIIPYREGGGDSESGTMMPAMNSTVPIAEAGMDTGMGEDAGMMGSEKVQQRWMDARAMGTALGTSSFFAGVPITDPLFLTYFVLVNILNSLAALFAMASTISVERDWVVVLTEDNDQLLATTNATMQRIDLMCKVLAPASIGFLVEFSPITWALCIVALWNVLSYFPEALALYGIHRKHRALLVKNAPSTVGDVETESTEGRDTDQGEDCENNDKPSKTGACWTGVYSAVQVYARQDAFLASLAFCWLFLTTLSPGGLTTAFLKSRGVSDALQGVWLGVSSLFGISATFVTPRLISTVGLVKMSAVMICAQWTVLLPATAVVPFLSSSTVGLTLIFLTSIALSRFPLWGFDLGERQIMQISIPTFERGVVNSTESSLTNLFMFIGSFLGLIVHDPDQFFILVIISHLAVTAAMATFLVYAFRHKEELVAVEHDHKQMWHDDLVKEEDDDLAGEEMKELGSEDREDAKREELPDSAER